ncbi:glycosyltransferase [Mucilaginibacter litoreus]|uniref:Glycosyltransferase n=1 Tax=Mucilaginibacter litoreus TaxID=1048221 RepID=A0ABW3AVY2_9SPHI
MNILIVSNNQIPVTKYGGTERIIWWLGRELDRIGHKVTYLVNQGSYCPFAKVIERDYNRDVAEQVPDDTDIVHFQYPVEGFGKKPFISTIHVNPPVGTQMHENSVFVSSNHAQRHGAVAYVHNSIDLADYPIPDLNKQRNHTHFLAKAAWRVKNVRGAIDVATKSHNKLIVLGGNRLNIKMGFRFTPNLNVRFKGMVDDRQKAVVMNASKALLFPVLWHEPFGIAIIESLYYGCPVFGTPYGALPELVPTGLGLLSDSRSALVNGLQNADAYDNQLCHQYAADNFNIGRMTLQYLDMYERVLNGEKLNAVKPAVAAAAQPKFLPWNN